MGLRRGPMRLRVALWLTVAAAVFWTNATLAQWSGTGLGQEQASRLDELPRVVLDTRERLYLRNADVSEAVLQTEEGQTFRYRYRGLRLLVQNGDRMFLVPCTEQVTRARTTRAARPSSCGSPTARACSSSPRSQGTDAKGQPSAAAVARVLARLPLVAPPVVAGHPGHQLLRVAALDVLEELLGARHLAGPSRGDRGAGTTTSPATLLELEALRSPCHRAEGMPRRHRCRAGFASP